MKGLGEKYGKAIELVLAALKINVVMNWEHGATRMLRKACLRSILMACSP
jgi:hypothetical protein